MYTLISSLATLSSLARLWPIERQFTRKRTVLILSQVRL